MFKKFLFAAALALTTLSLVGGAKATTGDGCFTVTNVPSWDVLNVRARPSVRSAIVDELHPIDHGIISTRGRCKPKHRYWKNRWCPIRHTTADRTTQGWVKRKYLQPAQCP